MTPYPSPLGPVRHCVVPPPAGDAQWRGEFLVSDGGEADFRPLKTVVFKPLTCLHMHLRYRHLPGQLAGVLTLHTATSTSHIGPLGSLRTLHTTTGTSQGSLLGSKPSTVLQAPPRAALWGPYPPHSYRDLPGQLFGVLILHTTKGTSQDSYLQVLTLDTAKGISQSRHPGS